MQEESCSVSKRTCGFGNLCCVFFNLSWNAFDGSKSESLITTRSIQFCTLVVLWGTPQTYTCNLLFLNVYIVNESLGTSAFELLSDRCVYILFLQLAEDKTLTDLPATCKEDVVCKKVLQHSYLKVLYLKLPVNLGCWQEDMWEECHSGYEKLN